VSAVQRALGLPDDSTIATVLTDREGRVAWMTTGAFSDPVGRQLTLALDSAGADATGRPPRR
jgi:predicted transcriptional regulator